MFTVKVPAIQDDYKSGDECITDYIRKEFPKLSGQSPCSYFIPQSYTGSEDPEKKQSDEAENCVFDKFNSYTSSQTDSQFVIFHSLEYGGKIKDKEKYNWREHDFVVFIKKCNSRKLLYCEVKSNPDNSKAKRISVAKEKAEFQITLAT